jgi:hypothetical protein
MNTSNITTSNVISTINITTPLINTSNIITSNINTSNFIYLQNAIVNSNLNVLANVAIGTSSTPNHLLDIRGTSGATMSLQGGAGVNPTILYINSTGAVNTTSQIRFVNLNHSITCTDSNLYNGWPSATPSGHSIFYNLWQRSSVFPGLVLNAVVVMGIQSYKAGRSA